MLCGPPRKQAMGERGCRGKMISVWLIGERRCEGKRGAFKRRGELSRRDERQVRFQEGSDRKLCLSPTPSRVASLLYLASSIVVVRLPLPLALCQPAAFILYPGRPSYTVILLSPRQRLQIPRGIHRGPEFRDNWWLAYITTKLCYLKESPLRS